MNLGTEKPVAAETVSKLSARPLGQLLVMQSVVGSLPNEKSIFSFVCKGLTDVPGVAAVAYVRNPSSVREASMAYFPLVAGASDYGELQVHLADPAAFAPYDSYLKNFAAMLAVILEERHQRLLNELHQVELEQRVQERTAQLTNQIAEHEATQALLRASEEKFRLMANGIPNIAWIADVDGQIFWYNSRWYEYTGTTPQEMETRGWQHIPAAELLPRILEQWNASLKSGQPFEMEVPLRGADGQFRPFLVRVLPLRNAEGHIVQWFGTNTDISEIVKARETLARSRVELERLVEERTVKLRDAVTNLEYFSYTITHDLRAPLRAMIGYGTILLDEMAVSPPAWEYLQRIVSAARRMDQLITETLNYSCMVRQEMSLHSVDAAALLRGIILTYPNLQPPGIEIGIEGDIPLMQANEAALTQCFSNLLNNAVKFVQPGLKSKVVVQAEDKGDLVRLWFHDNGIGISPENQRKIFDMFQRVDSQHEGTGIGLALVSKAVERMGGKVGVESEEGKGSHFWLEFKKAEANPVFREQEIVCVPTK